MAMLTVRGVPDEIHGALTAQARRHGRSAQAEIRAILAAALKPGDRVMLGTALASLGRQAELTEDEVARLSGPRHPTPAEPLDLS